MRKLYGKGIFDVDYSCQKFEKVLINGVYKNKKVWECPFIQDGGLCYIGATIKFTLKGSLLINIVQFVMNGCTSPTLNLGWRNKTGKVKFLIKTS